MAENEFVRIEVGLDGGTILSALVVPASADALDRSLNADVGGALSLDAQDGMILLVLPRVLYVKRFAREPRQTLGVFGERPGDYFDGDLAAELGIGGAVDLAHAAFAQLSRDAVVRDGLWAHWSIAGLRFSRCSVPAWDNQAAGLLLGAMAEER